MEDRFTEAYTRLNRRQREALDAIEGPVMVIAGPGTGKTQILTLRIAHILRTTDTSPESILALTFTESGARAMRERLRSYIGAAAHRVAIHTFHEFAGTLMRAYPDAYERTIGGRPATDLEKIALIEGVLAHSSITLLRPRGNPQYYVTPVLSAIGLMKREYITPDRFAAFIQTQEQRLREMLQFHEKGAHKGKVRSEYHAAETACAKNKELLFVYRAYDAALTDRHLYDFEDMIYETVRALEGNEQMLRDLQERFLYILADEHQDVNGSQNRILELLASFHDRPNIFVVGDEKQAIFRFQGASLENFLYFEDRFPHAQTIALTDNYRSTQDILDFAHALITAAETPAAALRIPLTATRLQAGAIERKTYTHEAIEDAALVREIKTYAERIPLREIAIIVRSNREVEHYAQLLRASGIPVDATADGDILNHPVTRAVRSLIASLVTPSDESALSALLHEPYWGIRTEDLVRVLRARTYDRPLSAIIEDAAHLDSLGLSDTATVLRVGSVLTSMRTKAFTTPPHRLIAALLRESGFIDHLMQHDPVEGGRTVRRLYDEIESLVRTHEATTLSDVLRMFVLRSEHTLPLVAPYIHTGADAVQVMTAHKSKGLEFTEVFIPHLTSRTWGDTPHRRLFTIPVTTRVDDDAFDALDDERKLLYVACTRAREGLHLSYAQENTAGRPQSLTPLLDGIDTALFTLVQDDAHFSPLDVFMPLQPFRIDTTFIGSVLRERGLSATALNNYLESPWNYLYRNVLRIPEIKSESAQFGTALHAALASGFAHRKTHGALPTTTELSAFLERALVRLPLTVEEHTRLHQHGLEALTHYLETVGPSLPPYTQEEVSLEAVLKTGDAAFPEVRLTGTLDRLDFDALLQNGGTLVRVVDYKSGKPKTRGQIEGVTKESNGNYKRQLVFYALLLSLQEDVRLRTRNFTLSFVEAEKGRIREESYVVTDAEIDALTEEIRGVVRSIVRGTFLTEPCDPERSDYCHLVDLRRV
jgi:DNA helicase II / ATP-dependent DNA helicase PcrA